MALMEKVSHIKRTHTWLTGRVKETIKGKKASFMKYKSYINKEN